MSNKREVLGIFDSGLGGLTVVKEVMQIIPYESVVYLGDTARVPYGTKSRETVERFATEILTFLNQFNLKMLVVACNTVSSVALDRLKEMTDIPVIGVIEPGARASVKATETGNVAVIGTKTTIQSKEYIRIIHSLNPRIIVHQKACPLFVPLIEEGWYEDELAETIARRYLEHLLDKNIDTVVLGCTHYPLIKSTIRKVFGEDITLIDSAYETASLVREELKDKDILTGPENGEVEHRFFVTDIPNDFYKIARTFLEMDDISVEKVEIDGILKK